VTPPTHGLNGKSPLSDRLVELVRRILGPPAGTGPIPIEGRLTDVGMSSIKMVGFMLAIEAELDIVIPQAQITPENFQSIASVESLVRELMDSARG
jgi:acyl carrier protein